MIISDHVFCVRSVDRKGAPCAFVSAKFPTIDGQPVVGAGAGATWTFALRQIDPANPTRPMNPSKPNGPLGIVTYEPMPDWPIPPPIFNVR
jgi:hypothetical protein